MEIEEAISLIRPAVTPSSGTWADIGAGTGLFTMALMEILEEGKILAVDKSPHALYQIKPSGKTDFEIIEADFHQPLDLPSLDGIIMANSLHYAKDHLAVLNNVLDPLKPGGTFILVEYDTNTPNYPWVPNPVPIERFFQLCTIAGLKEPSIIGRRKSIYQDGDLYIAKTSSKT